MRWEGVLAGLVMTTLLGCSGTERPATEIASAADHNGERGGGSRPPRVALQGVGDGPDHDLR